MLPVLDFHCILLMSKYSQSVHNAENSSGELKIFMVQLLDSNRILAQRMSSIETLFVTSVSNKRESISTSHLSQETIRGPMSSALETNSGTDLYNHSLLAFEFEDDLQTSWVYQRSTNREPGAYSISTSTRLTQS